MNNQGVGRHDGAEVAGVKVMKTWTGWMVMVLTVAGPVLGGDTDNRYRPATYAAWAVLNQGIADSNVLHRQQAVLAAANIGATPEAAKFIGRAIEDKAPIVRQTAAAVLGRLKAPEGVPYLEQALDDKDPEVWFTAARSLVAMGNPDGRNLVEEVLTGERKDKPSFLQKEMTHAKKDLTPAELAFMGAKAATGAMFGPAEIGIVVMEKAVKGSKGDGISNRTIAVATLADHPNDYTRMLLEWALTDSDQTVRAAAAKGLARCGNQESILKLETAMNDPHTAVRLMAAASVIRLSGKGGPLGPGPVEKLPAEK